MSIFKQFDRRVKKFNFFDIKLVQGTTIFVVLIVVKLIPQILNINIWWFVVLFIVCLIKPLYVFYIKK